MLSSGSATYYIWSTGLPSSCQSTDSTYLAHKGMQTPSNFWPRHTIHDTNVTSLPVSLTTHHAVWSWQGGHICIVYGVPGSKVTRCLHALNRRCRSECCHRRSTCFSGFSDAASLICHFWYFPLEIFSWKFSLSNCNWSRLIISWRTKSSFGANKIHDYSWKAWCFRGIHYISVYREYGSKNFITKTWSFSDQLDTKMRVLIPLVSII